MTDRKRFMRKGLSWLLSAALTVGLLSVTGLTAGAETVVPDQTVSQEKEVTEETATVSDAEKTEETGTDSTPAAEEEPLDEEGYLMDGNIADIPDIDPEEEGTATPSAALTA